ncbi:MAG: DNA polymerase Y family protein [Actinomycetota bacterium]|nr:DNA polymerase Y family protein [Actinomycetota bacterium]
MAQSRLRMLTVWWAHWPIVAAGATRDVAIVLKSNRVVACSPAASASGVAIGQRRRVAQQRCPGAALLDHDPDRDAHMFEPVVRALGEFTPRLEMVEPGWLCVESRGPSRYFGGDEQLVAQIVDVIAATVGRDVDLTGLGVGIADGRFASAVVARLAIARSGRSMVVPPGAARAFLAPQPVSWLQQTGDADAELVGLFARLGLTRLGTLADIARADIADRFGPPGEHTHRLACADDDRPSRAQEPPAERMVERVFDDPVVQLEPLVFVGKQLADGLVAELTMAGLVCTRLVVTSETEHGERSERVWYRASGLSAMAIVERVRWQLEGWVSQPGGLSSGVVVLRLNPDELRHDGGDQLRLWGGLSAADERAVRAVTRLAGMAGEQAVLVPAWQGGRLPGDRYRWVPATTTDLTDPDDTAQRLRPRLDSQPSPKRRGKRRRKEPNESARSAPWPGSLPAPSPAVVLDARRAVVMDLEGVPVAVCGRGELTATPVTLAIGGRKPQDITGWAGPWPVDEWWWDERRHRRLARFQIVTADGAAHLVAVERQHWWVLATYG